MSEQGRLVGTLRCLVRLSFDHVLQPWPVAAPSIDVLIVQLTPTTGVTEIGARSNDSHPTPARPWLAKALIHPAADTPRQWVGTVQP